jgi:asparagine synthase (glutamine-hydrolysing)
VSSADALKLIPNLAAIYAEPFADSSQILTHLLARLTRVHVTVSLSGDCGDELFGGYQRYQLAAKVWPILSKVPRGVRGFVAAGLMNVPARFWDQAANWLSTDMPAPNRWSRLGEKAQKVASLLAMRNVDDLYLALVSHWPDPGEIVVGGVETTPLTPSAIPQVAQLCDVERMMITDILGYMSDDILTKVDRATMAASLESRVPMLDHRVAEFAWRLPIEYKLRDGQAKWILRQVLYRYVPRNLIERTKSGFAVPIDNWLRGPLREWAEDLLCESGLKRSGYLQPAPIRKRWLEHLRGQHNWHPQLWNVLMFLTWLEHAHG